MICQFDEANRTNNHSEAFHRGVGCAVQVAHPQTLVLIQLLVKVEHDTMLRFNDQRAGKNIKPNDRHFAELERQITKTTRSYNDGLFLNDVEYLSAIAKLYVEYDHKLKIARIRSSMNVIDMVAEVRDTVIKALDEQNLVFFGEDDEKAKNETKTIRLSRPTSQLRSSSTQTYSTTRTTEIRVLCSSVRPLHRRRYQLKSAQKSLFLKNGDERQSQRQSTKRSRGSILNGREEHCFNA